MRIIKTIITIALLCVITVCFAQQPNLQILGLFKDKVFLVYKGKNKVVSVGDELEDNFKLVAADSRGAIFDYNGEKYEYGISFHISSDFIDKNPINKVTIQADPQDKYKINATINGNQVVALVDPKELESLVSSEYADKINLKYKNKASFDLISARGKDIGYRVVLDQVVLDKIKVSTVDVVVVKGKYPEQPLLGKNFLNKLKVNEDKNKKTIILQQ